MCLGVPILSEVRGAIFRELSNDRRVEGVPSDRYNEPVMQEDEIREKTIRLRRLLQEVDYWKHEMNYWKGQCIRVEENVRALKKQCEEGEARLRELKEAEGGGENFWRRFFRRIRPRTQRNEVTLPRMDGTSPKIRVEEEGDGSLGEGDKGRCP